MQLGTVVGSANGTLKHASLQGRKMLVVQPQGADGRLDGMPLVAVDGVGAGPGQSVMLSSDGRAARALLGDVVTPVRWTIVGIQDA
ncbi:MAG: ethanolamine utilization protein EutN [Planctomycetaceae bacterium]|nr:ethanolamine utilization protein EutN [Planctomycetaceae bacterium]